MDIIVNQEFESKEELVKFLEEEQFFLEDEFFPEVSIDISKFLRDDFSINLELLEISIEHISNKSLPDVIYISGFPSYFELRGLLLEDDGRKEQECVFIYNIVTSLVSEFCDRKIKVIIK